MKRTVVLVAGLAALGTGLYVGSRLWADPATPAGGATPPAPQTRIAVMNLGKVLNGYKKTEKFRAEFKALFEACDSDLKGVEVKFNAAQAKFKDAKTPQAEREQLEAEMKKLQREMEDKQKEGQKKLKNKENEQITIIYRDIEAMTSVIAKSRGIELVMHYNDAINPADLYNPVNIGQKLQMPACMPLYTAPGMDISDEVVRGLDYNYNKAEATQGKPAGGQ